MEFFTNLDNVDPNNVNLGDNTASIMILDNLLSLPYQRTARESSQNRAMLCSTAQLRSTMPTGLHQKSLS